MSDQLELERQVDSMKSQLGPIERALEAGNIEDAKTCVACLRLILYGD